MKRADECGFQRVGEPAVGPDGVAEVLFPYDGAAGLADELTVGSR
jgi:hypothetical protein